MIDLFAPEDVDDPYPLFARLREEAPVYRVPGTDAYLVASWDLVQDANSRVADFSSNLTSILLTSSSDRTPRHFQIDLDGTVEHVLATADDPVHQVHRKLVLGTLTKRARALEEYANETADGLWETHATGGRIDWVAGMAENLPLALLAALIGLPENDLPYLLSLAYDSTEMLGGIVEADRMGRLVDAAVELGRYLEERFVEARRDPQDDLMGVLAGAADEGSLASSTAAMMLIQLVAAGAESTAALIETAARKLAEDDDLQGRLRHEPSLIDPFLDECLRLESPFRGHYRHVVRDAELGGVPLAAGSTLLLLWGAANRDPARFPHPDVLDLERDLIRQHLAFGKGAHFCVGSVLARMEASAAIRVLLERTSHVTLDPGRPPTWIPSVVVRRHRTLDLVWR